MKNPYPLTALLPVLMLCACGDDSKQPHADSDTVVQQPPVDTTPKPAATTKYAGTYSFGTDPEKPTGSLLIYPIDDTLALAHLDVQNGAPAHNSGSLTQSIAILADTGEIWIGTNDDGECKIALHFNGDEVSVQTHVAKGCGFGKGVMPDNVYKRSSAEVPQYYIDGQSDTVWFSAIMKNGLNMHPH